ncbi:hypothetical protein TL16_g08799, partial [Triparma laevis f. inornata]
RVYVGNLAWDVAWQDLKDHMRTAGPVTFAEVMSEADGRSKGCGIVEFSNPEAAKSSIETLNDTELKGRMIFVREDRETRNGQQQQGGGKKWESSRINKNKDREAGKGSGSTQLYVGNLAYEVTWKELKDHFRSCGDVERADVQYLPDEPSKSKGWGTVKMARARDAQNAIDRLNGSFLMERAIQVRVDNK